MLRRKRERERDREKEKKRIYPKNSISIGIKIGKKTLLFSKESFPVSNRAGNLIREKEKERDREREGN